MFLFFCGSSLFTGEVVATGQYNFRTWGTADLSNDPEKFWMFFKLNLGIGVYSLFLSFYKFPALEKIGQKIKWFLKDQK